MFEIAYRKSGRLVRVQYATLDQAKAAAAEIFDKTGIVVGIHKL